MGIPTREKDYRCFARLSIQSAEREARVELNTCRSVTVLCNLDMQRTGGTPSRAPFQQENRAMEIIDQVEADGKTFDA
jgi:hypothetical protein